MNTLTKGALAMVLAGSVTFSVTNALLVDQSSKRLTEENALPVSEDQNKADVISQAEKPVKDQTPTTNVKDGQTGLSHEIPAIQVDFKNRKKIDRAIADIQKNTKKSSKSTTTNPANTKETPTITPSSTPKETNTTSATTTSAATTKPATSAKAPTTTPASRPTGTNTTSAATTPAATTKPATGSKTTTATTAPTPKGITTTSTTTTTTNRGQQVSQTAKEKVASHQDKKENNGKKM